MIGPRIEIEGTVKLQRRSESVLYGKGQDSLHGARDI